MTTSTQQLSGAGSDGYALLGTFFSNGLATGFYAATYNLYGGVWFGSVTVPQGIVLDSAILRLVADNSAGVGSTGTSFGTWYGHKVADAAGWSSHNRPDQITKTTASAPCLGSATNGTVLDHDVRAIVQEIINQPGWVTNHAMAFATDPTGADGTAEYADCDFLPASAATLILTWGTGGGTPAPPPHPFLSFT